MKLLIEITNEKQQKQGYDIDIKENYNNYLKLLFIIQEELPEILNEVYILLITLINDKKLNKVAARKSIGTITKDNKMFIVTFNIILIKNQAEEIKQY